MDNFKQNLKKILPIPILNVFRSTLDGLERAPLLPEAYLHPWRRNTMAELKRYKDLHKGERCFIIANGPSLKQTDLKKLKNEYTIGMNRIYLAFSDMGFQTSYYTCINDLVLQQCAGDIQNLEMPKFISWRNGKKWLSPQENLFYLFTTYTGKKFARDIRYRLWEGATVTYTAMQLAFFLGFEKVILVGVDHNFVTQGKPNTTVVSQGDDPNHFNPNYFGKGFAWQLPDLETSERAYELARLTYSQAGREIVDATIAGKLRVFPRVDYDSLF